MRRTVRWLAFPAVVGLLVLLAGSSGGRQSVAAQDKVPTVTRMFTGPDGLTHFEEVKMPAGELIKVAAVRFNVPAAGNQNPNPRVLDWHTAPHRRYVVTLSGKAEIVGSAGNKLFIADRDHILLAEDLTGKGHTTKGINWVTLFVEVDPPQPAQGRTQN
jgi:hypothetical protein